MRSCSIRSTSIATPRPTSARRRSRGHRRRCSCIISASSRARPRLFQRLASHVIYAGPALRPSSDMIRQGAGPQSGLWSQGISGDLPIVLLRIAEIENIGVAQPDAASTRILADEAARRRSRHSERASILLCPGPSDRAGDSGSRRPVAAGSWSRACAAGGSIVLRADLIDASTRCVAHLRRACRDLGAARQPVGATRSRHRAALADPAASPNPQPRARSLRRLRRRRELECLQRARRLWLRTARNM